ncbi:hypothetical protein [Hymenobacter sp. GOD-10R]|uniref:hypothetical protein n=1 Tax=Hymenobacter sp. GOD-10R TaxID=3093922 RepID=UPI002D76D359|nr:hypothetical protein [Hymenobacter sp. GOD-10R]WRQ28327.1 hypothetical protein SD425_24980 [Hymenobacter sp. GOD-10R]
MRRYLLLLTPFLFLMLAACDPGVTSGPRIDFVGSSRFTSSDRILSTPGDTISSFLYADNRDRDTTDDKEYSPLRHLRVVVIYQPGLTPSTYLTNALAPADTITYLDSTLANNTSSFVFRHDFTNRTTPGRETWRFEVEDANNNKASRQYRLTTRRTDSAAVIHSYSTLLQAPQTRLRARRSFLDATNGLALTGYAATNPGFQKLIDLVYVPGPNNAFGLAAPSATATAMSAAGTSAWPTKNITELRTTTLKLTNFNNANNPDALRTGFNDGTVASGSDSYIPSIAEGDVIAFRTTTGDQRTGLIYVQDILPTVIPTVLLQIRVSKSKLQ